ncbi:MAG: OmpA family protein [Rhodospirillaceae bacterium]
MPALKTPFADPAHRRAAALAAMTGAALLAMAVDPARAGERFDAGCMPETGRGQPNAVIITGFKTGKSDVPETHEQGIARAADTFKHAGKICVVGQADKRGAYAMNDTLAMNRARAVAARLIAAGVDPRNLSLSSRAEFYGDGMPDWLWFAGDRRVEIIAVE